MIESEREDFHRGVAVFDGSNFPAWKFRMMIVLEEHDLLECIEAEIGDMDELKIDPEESEAVKQQKMVAIEKRIKKNKRCKSLIVNRVHDNYLEHLEGKETPKQMWNALEKIFERKSVAKRLHLNRQLHEFHHTSGDLQQHFVMYDRLIRQYRNSGGKIDDIDVVCRLLLSLGTEYDAVVTSIESQPEEQLTMDFVKCRLLDEEIKRKSLVEDAVEDRREAAAFSGNSGRKPNQRKLFKCFGCQKEGHKLADCPKKKKQKEKFSGNSAAYSTEKQEDGIMFLMDGQHEENRIKWYVDSGATEHICNDRRLFSKLTLLKQPMHIAVAKNGEWVTAEYYGDVAILSGVGDKVIQSTVKHCLFIPEARCNLFSLSKVEAAGMKVVFEGGRVEIFHNAVVVATGERREKLYELNFFTSTKESEFFWSN